MASLTIPRVMQAFRVVVGADELPVDGPTCRGPNWGVDLNWTDVIEQTTKIIGCC